ncbi:MAG: hypothetical protein ACK47B_16085 [Armatimonadota bacterium]
MLTRRACLGTGVAGALLFGALTAAPAQAPEPLKVGEKAPEFTLKSVDDKTVTLSEVAKKNKATLVNFFFNG